MAIFAVISTDPKPELETAIVRLYAGDKQYRFTDRVWFIADAGTAREVSEKLNVKRGGTTGVVVFLMSSAYYGVASSSLWDWLRARVEEDADGE